MSYRHRSTAAYYCDSVVDERKLREEIERLMKDFPPHKIKRDFERIEFKTIIYGRGKTYIKEVRRE